MITRREPGERHVAVRRYRLVRAVDRNRVTVGIEVHTGGVRPDDQAAHRRARHVKVRGRRLGGADGDVPRVVDSGDGVYRGRHQTVGGNHVDRDLVVALREPVEIGGSVVRGRLAPGVVHPDLIAVGIEVGARGGVDGDDRGAPREKTSLPRRTLRTLWIVTRGREPEHRERRCQAAQVNGAYHEFPPRSVLGVSEGFLRNSGVDE